MSQRPTVVVSSTFYDLREIRAALESFLHDEMGYAALLSESPAFPIDTDVGTIENCRRRVERDADVLILLIGTRYGSVDPVLAKSVTNIEYLAAKAKGIPIYAYLDKKALTLFEAWRDAESMARSAFASTVDDGRLFEFIDSVRQTDSVWMVAFERAADIIGALRGQFAYQQKKGLDLALQFTTNPDGKVLRTLSGAALRIATERPAAWAPLLFAQVVDDEVTALAPERQEYDLAIAYGERAYIDLLGFGSWARARLAEMRQLTQAINLVVNEKLGSAFQADHVAGIVFVARQVSKIYREAIDWSARVRRADVDRQDLERIVVLLAGVSGDVVSKIGDCAAMIRARIQSELKDPTPRTIAIDISFGMPGAAELLAALDQLGP